MMVFDQRIKYFGKEGYVLGLKGYELVELDKSRSEEAFTYLQKSLDSEKNNASVQAVYGYMKAIVNLEKKGEKTKQDVLDAYAFVSELLILILIANETKSAKNFSKYSPIIENLFTPYANCDDLIALFSKKFDFSTNNVEFLQRIIKLLSNKDCTESDLFFNVSKRLYELDPSSFSANQMSKMSITKGKLSEAIVYAKKGSRLEEDIDKKQNII